MAEWAIKIPNPGPTVGKYEGAVETDALTPRERPKMRVGEPYRFSIDLVCEPTSEFGKRAIVLNPTPGGTQYEINCDEGKAIGGGDTAPYPLAYFTAGVAFCLMTHITGFLRFKPLKVSKLKLEMRANYMTKLGHVDQGGQGEGGCDSFQTYVIIESDEPPEKIQEFVELCERACIASQTLAQAIPASVNVVLNGNQID